MKRKQKIARNVMICLALIFSIHAAMGFPPYTVKGMCRQVQRDYLLPELEPLYTFREKHSYSGEWLDRTYTFIIARCRDTYFSFQYDRDVLRQELMYSRNVDVGEGHLFMARKGMMYLVGDFTGIETATAVVRATNGVDVKDFSFAGELLAEGVYGFCYSERDLVFLDDSKRVEEMDLGEISMYWYRTPHGENGDSYDHAELPVTVTLKDGAGNTVQTLEMSVGTYELHSWY